MLVSLTVGKVDAGVAVLLTEDKRLIEFPSILLPPSIQSGSIVDITVSQNHQAEKKSQAEFASLQAQILNTYGLQAPDAPVLRCRNATQTSLVLEWDPMQLATSTLRSLALYRNGSKAGNIPRPLDMLSTKISGLAIDTEYSFYLVLRTSGGTYTSNTLVVKTHDMSNLTGITVTPGVLPQQLRESLEKAVKRIGAKIVDTVRIDTTHFICTEGRGRDWERANEMNIPVVRPEWIEGCEREGKLIGVRGYYLDANPKHRQVGSNPSLTNTQGSPGTQAAIAATQAPEMNLASRTTSHTSPPGSGKEKEKVDDGEPGPELPPTPPPKEERDVPEDDSEDEETLKATDEKQIERGQPTVESEEEEEEDERDDQQETLKKGRAASEVKDERKGNEEMEDVAL